MPAKKAICIGRCGSAARSPLKLPDVVAEQTAAAGGDDIRLYAGKIGEQQAPLQHQQRHQQIEQFVFDLDQRVVIAPVIGMVDDQPDPGQQEIDDLEQQRRIAEGIDRESAGRAHGAGERACAGRRRCR